jgi:hypothetical protein
LRVGRLLMDRGIYQDVDIVVERLGQLDYLSDRTRPHSAFLRQAPVGGSFDGNQLSVSGDQGNVVSESPPRRIA